MKRVIDVITYFIKCANAIGEGAKAAAAAWPTDNPFADTDTGGAKVSE